jgi:hypothetical protein
VLKNIPMLAGIAIFLSNCGMGSDVRFKKNALKVKLLSR